MFAVLMHLNEVQKEIRREKSLEAWRRRCSNHFTEKVKRMLFEEIDNIVWSGCEKEISEWCERNKVYDEITEKEIEEILSKQDPGDEPIRLNGKYVWETEKRARDYINAHEELTQISPFGEDREVVNKVMKVIRESNNVERKRR